MPDSTDLLWEPSAAARASNLTAYAWARSIRERCFPRHAPDSVTRIAAVPRTLSGKVVEVRVKRILMGADPSKVVSRDSPANPEALDWFVGLARD
jgi:acetoacetyl-CoA synthetase